MLDACDPGHIPADAEMVAGYLNGVCVWPAQAWTRFAGKVAVRIATNPTIDAGAVIDCERGDATPADVPGWCARARLRGQIPTVYTSASNLQAVRDACTLHGVPMPLVWVAQWDDVAELPAGCIAKQYANQQPPGCDSSIVADYWPGVDPAPAPIQEGTIHVYPYIVQNAHSGDYLVNSDRSMVALGSAADVTAYEAAGFKVVNVTDAMFQNLKAVSTNPPTIP